VDTGPERRVFNQKRVKTALLKLVIKTDLAVRPEHGVRWRRLAKLHRGTMHGQVRRLAAIGGELKRIGECDGLPQSVAEEAESLVKRFSTWWGVSSLKSPLWPSCGLRQRRLVRLSRRGTASNVAGLRSVE
jgi:hypothetical protein